MSDERRTYLEALMKMDGNKYVMHNGQRKTVAEVIQRMLKEGDGDTAAVYPARPQTGPGISGAAVSPSASALQDLSDSQIEALRSGEGIEGLTKPPATRVKVTNIGHGTRVTHFTNSQDGKVVPSADPFRSMEAEPAEQRMRVRQITRD